MSDPRVIVFDFDGVILESTGIKTRAFAALFADHPEHVDSIVQLHLGGVGLSRYEKFALIYRDILRLPLDDDEIERLDRAFSRLVVDEILACPFVAGAPEFLRSPPSGQLLYVASATPEDELRHIVDRRGLAHLFRGVYGSPTSKTEIISRILRQTGTDPSEVLVIGDGRSDLEAAHNVGALFVGRRVPGEPNAFDQDSVPVVDDLDDLAKRWEWIVAASAVG